MTTKPILWSTELQMTPGRYDFIETYDLMRAAKRKSGLVAASCNCQAATRRCPSGRRARPEKSLQALEMAQNGPGHDGPRFAPKSAALAVAASLSCEACRILVCSPIRVIHDVLTPSKRRDCEQARAVGRRVAGGRSKPRLGAAAACSMAAAPLGHQVRASGRGLRAAHTTTKTTQRRRLNISPPAIMTGLFTRLRGAGADEAARPGLMLIFGGESAVFDRGSSFPQWRRGANREHTSGAYLGSLEKEVLEHPKTGDQHDKHRRHRRR